MLAAMSNFEELVVAYRKRLYAYAVQLLRNREDAEEAVQDAFVRAYRAWDKMDPRPCDGARLRGWLFKITLNVVRNRFRKKHLAQVCIDELKDTQARHSSLEDHSSPDTLVDQHATFRLVQNAIHSLPAHLHEAANLRFIEDLTHPEIAERCSQPVGTIKSQVFRARLLLRAQLAPALKKSA
jgi:RNA polymerase sigma-70 factor (ECF subfamily)